MGGNFVIGVIVFAILVIVNFVVITKGSGRIAEVAARFNLDAMPGKQMAIDADLSAGLIDEKEARTRRKNLEDENGFFGAMDGASKFVRGDAIAGLLVVGINVIGGMIIGIMQQGMPFAEAARTYTLLTVGDGLVTQIPALIVSTAAGLLVTKAGVSGVGRQGAVPAALRLSQGAWHVRRRDAGHVAPARHSDAAVPCAGRRRLCNRLSAEPEAIAAEAETEADQVQHEATAAAAAAAAEEPISAALKIDDLKIELGYALLPLVELDRWRRPADRADQGAAPVAGDRDGLRDARRAHPRQRPARSQRLCHQDQGGRGRLGQDLAGPVHGHGSRRRPGETARPCTRPSRPSACPPPGSTSPRRKRPRSRATPSSMPRPSFRPT